MLFQTIIAAINQSIHKSNQGQANKQFEDWASVTDKFQNNNNNKMILTKNDKHRLLTF